MGVLVREWGEGGKRVRILIVLRFFRCLLQAPEMFNPEHAWKALDVVESSLVGPLGVATLDPR